MQPRLLLALRDKCLTIIQNDIPPNITHTPCACQIMSVLLSRCLSMPHFVANVKLDWAHKHTRTHMQITRTTRAVEPF